MFRATMTAMLAAFLIPCAAAADWRLVPEPEGHEAAGIVSEVRAGVLQHDVRVIAADGEPGQAVNAEILFDSPGFLDILWSPRPHVGATVAIEGETDQIYAGLTWTVRPAAGGSLQPLWLSVFGGGALHDGELDTPDPDKNSLGFPALFRFGAEVGWDVTDSISLSAYYAHISNAYLANPNEGLDQLGVRAGWRF